MEGLKPRGPEALSPANRGCSLAGDWRAAAAPLAPSPSSRWPETRALPTKNSWARPVLLGLFKCGAAAAAEVSQERGWLQETLGPHGIGLSSSAKGAVASSVREGAR